MFHKRFLLLGCLLAIALACNLISSTVGTGEVDDTGSAPEGGGESTSLSASVSEIENQVEAHDAPEIDWQPANDGQQVGQGGEVRTLAESRARLDFSDGSLLRMASNTLIAITRYEPSAWTTNLSNGKVWLKAFAVAVLGDIQVETPVGVAAVRGSLLSVSYDAEQQVMIATCLEGECQLANAAGQTDMKPGDQSEILGPGLPPTPAHPMDPAELADWATIPEAATALALIAPTPTPTPPSGGGAPGDEPTATPMPGGAQLTPRPGAWLYESVVGSASCVSGGPVQSPSGNVSLAVADDGDSFTVAFPNTTLQFDRSGPNTFETAPIVTSGGTAENPLTITLVWRLTALSETELAGNLTADTTEPCTIIHDIHMEWLED